MTLMFQKEVAERQVARTARRRAAADAQEALHQPILEAVEGNDREPPAWLEHALRRRQPVGEFFKLAVEVDADRLKGARRRIFLVVRLVAERLAHHRGKRPRARDRKSTRLNSSH